MTSSTGVEQSVQQGKHRISDQHWIHIAKSLGRDVDA